MKFRTDNETRPIIGKIYEVDFIEWDKVKVLSNEEDIDGRPGYRVKIIRMKNGAHFSYLNTNSFSRLHEFVKFKPKKT